MNNKLYWCVCVSGGGGGVHELSELCTNIHFGHVQTADIILKSIKLACCESSKLVPVMSSDLDTCHQMSLALHIVLNHINLACCGSSKHIPVTVTPSGTHTQMTDLIYFSPDVTVFGGAFL